MQVLAERDAESKDLRLNINELEANTEDLHTKFEAALAHLEREAEEKDNEIETLTDAIKELGEQVYNLEDERDRIRDTADRMREDDDVEKERLEAIQAALKEVCLSFNLLQVYLLIRRRNCPRSKLNFKRQPKRMKHAAEKSMHIAHDKRNLRNTSRSWSKR